jgi:hypothetical protein
MLRVLLWNPLPMLPFIPVVQLPKLVNDLLPKDELPTSSGEKNRVQQPSYPTRVSSRRSAQAARMRLQQQQGEGTLVTKLSCTGP